jgi:hypothetical protein
MQASPEARLRRLRLRLCRPHRRAEARRSGECLTRVGC